MKLAESACNNSGQSLIELLISIAVFVTVMVGFGFFVLDSYVSDRLAKELMIADALAQEGIEAVVSIRDNSWDSLTEGSYGLSVSGGNWALVSGPENLSDLSDGTRTIIIEDMGQDRKKITSQVDWDFNQARPEQANLVTYLTNWQQISSGTEIRRPTAYSDPSLKTTNPQLAYDASDGTTWAITIYNTSLDPATTFHTWESTSRTYNALDLYYRYHADLAADDTYAVFYSINGGTSWLSLVPATSAGITDTTVSVSLNPSQDLSQLRLKIVTVKNSKPENKNVYTRDIWTEGAF